MNCIVPFNKKIKFDTNIAEISSISLEHEITINDDSLLGNFLLSGEYKSHEVSVNTESFNYTLPFDVSLPKNLARDSIVFDIKDFTYKILENSYLVIDIEFSVTGDENLEEKNELSEVLSFEENSKTDNLRDVENLEQIETEVEKNDININDNKKNILDMATKSDESFVTYRIHIVKENENMDSICKLYNEPENIIIDYNSLSDIKPGDKIIIPIDE